LARSQFFDELLNKVVVLFDKKIRLKVGQYGKYHSLADMPAAESVHAKRVLANLKTKNLRRLFRSARVPHGVAGKKVQR
jgi:hypothetical protein